MSATATAAGEDRRRLFGRAVEVAVRRWGALRMAEEQSFGGQFSREKAEWLPKATTDWFLENDGIQPYELEEFLSTLLDQEFDTIVDDGSTAEIADKICELFGKCFNGSLSEVQEYVDKASPKQSPPLPSPPPPPPPPPPSQIPSEAQQDPCLPHSPDEDGWQVVTHPTRRSKS